MTARWTEEVAGEGPGPAGEWRDEQCWSRQCLFKAISEKPESGEAGWAHKSGWGELTKANVRV